MSSPMVRMLLVSSSDILMVLHIVVEKVFQSLRKAQSLQQLLGIKVGRAETSSVLKFLIRTLHSIDKEI